MSEADRRPPDWPQLWLALGLFFAWFFGVGWGQVAVGLGWILVGLGLALMVAALMEMHRAGATAVPNRLPETLVTSGVFAFTRNPIYLGDALVIAGSSLIFGSLIGLLFVPVFIVVITRRFVRPEEARLSQAFGPSFEAYAKKTPRWLGLVWPG